MGYYLPMRPILFALAFAPALAAQTFTLDQVLSVPYSTTLTAAPRGKTFAWVTNSLGRRNLWLDTVGAPALQLTHYTLDDGQDIDDLVFDPDAATVYFTRGSAAQGADHPVPNPAHLVPGVEQQIFSVAVVGNAEPKLLAAGHGTQISPKGDTLAFLRAGQIWTLSLHDANAKPQQLFQARGTQTHLRWSPDGSALAFVSNRGDHALIGIYRFDTQTLLFADPGTGQDSDPVWSPDSQHIAFLRNPTDYDKYENRWAHEGDPWQIRVADAHTAEGNLVWTALTGTGSLYRELGSPNNLIWTNDGHLIFPWERDGWLHLYSMPVAGGEPRLLTPGDFEVDHVAYAPGQNALIYSSNQVVKDTLDLDRRHLWRVADDAASQPKELTPGAGIEVKPVVAQDGTIAFLHSDAIMPVRPATLSGDLAPQLVPTSFPASQLVTPQQVIFSATDGLKIHGQLFLPKNHKLEKNGRHPALLFIHGGSRRQMYLGWNPMEYYSNAYAENQYLCSLGYIVLSVNYRSGIGYGMEFRQATDYGFHGASEYRDIVGAGKYLQTRHDVDANRIGSWGGSYGGYLTALALARNSDIFAAGVDYHGVHDWVLEMGLSRPGTDSSADRVQAQEKMAQTAWLSSPMASLEQWKSPVLLIQGDDDRNVVFSQTVRLYQKLKEQHVDVEEKVFPDEIHDFLLHSSWRTSYQLTADFFQRKMADR